MQKCSLCTKKMYANGEKMYKKSKKTKKNLVV